MSPGNLPINDGSNVDVGHRDSIEQSPQLADFELGIKNQPHVPRRSAGFLSRRSAGSAPFVIYRLGLQRRQYGCSLRSQRRLLSPSAAEMGAG